jgi:hypothetical protein
MMKSFVSGSLNAGECVFDSLFPYATVKVVFVLARTKFGLQLHMQTKVASSIPVHDDVK